MFTPAEDYYQKHVLRRVGEIFRKFRVHFENEGKFADSTAAAWLSGYLGCNGEPAILEKEISLLGLSPQLQVNLSEVIATSCGNRFKGLTCPAPQ
jgi:hypothetical protein